MKLDNMFKKTRIVSRIQSHSAVRASRPEVPEGLLRKCNKCGAAIIAEDVKQGYYICPKCGGYFRVHAYRRIQMVIDEGTFEEWNQDLIGGNPVNYKGYPEKSTGTSGEDRAQRGCCHRQRQNKWQRYCDRSLRWKIPDGKHGLGSWRKNHQSSRTCNGGKTSHYHFCLFWWCQNAGRNHISDADGKKLPRRWNVTARPDCFM